MWKIVYFNMKEEKRLKHLIWKYWLFLSHFLASLVSAEAGGAFQDQQEGAHIIRVHHPGCPGDGALPPREQSDASLQTAGAAGVAAPGSTAPRHTPLSQHLWTAALWCLAQRVRGHTGILLLCARRQSSATLWWQKPPRNQSDDTLWSMVESLEVKSITARPRFSLQHYFWYFKYKKTNKKRNRDVSFWPETLTTDPDVKDTFSCVFF